MSSNSSTPPPGISPALWALLIELPKGCYPNLIPRVKNSYSYHPHLAAGVVFCVAFGVALLGHVIQSARFRRWTSFLFAVGALTEAIGWAGRTWSAKCPYNHDAFLMQITTLIIAPTFFAAGLYVILGQMIHLLGRNTSIISPRAYLMVFCSCDLVSLVLQAAGGGLASVASGKLNGNTKPGTNLMVAGIAFQLGTMSFFALLVLDFLRRTRRLAMSLEYKKVLVALFVSFTMIYIRSVYRTIELAQGWTGYLITHEGYFIGLDAALMFIAVAVFLVFDPAILLPKDTPALEGSATENIPENANDKTRSK